MKPGDKIHIIKEGKIYSRIIERITKTQIICFGENRQKLSGNQAEKFNIKTGKAVGDYIIDYRIYKS